MHQLLNLLFILTLATTITNGQSTYEKGMEKAFELLEADQKTAALALFERIAQVETDKWVPLYHIINEMINGTFGMESKKERTPILEKANTLLQEAHRRSPNNSELVTLEGLLYLSYLQMSPMLYGMTYPAKIKKLHDKAIELNPDNPRAYLNKIQFEMGSASFFGKDLTPYCEQMKEIIPKFQEQVILEPYAPSFGLEAAQGVVNSCDD